jgi:hypothetical protein
LLRPELVVQNDRPLCSDAFSGWNTDADAEIRRKLNADVGEATRTLYEQAIPATAAALDDAPDLCHTVFCTHGDRLSPRGSHADLHLRAALEDALQLYDSGFFHSRGLGLRHLGSVRCRSANGDSRRLLLTVCVARCLKTEVNARMRHRIQKRTRRGNPAEDIADVLNLCFSGINGVSDTGEETFESERRRAASVISPAVSDLTTQMANRTKCVQSISNKYWTGLGTRDETRYGDLPFVFSMKASLRCKFAECLSQDELDAACDLRSCFDVAFAAALVLRYLRIELIPGAMKQLLLQPWTKEELWFAPSDFSFSGPVVKSVHLADMANGLSLLYSAPTQPDHAAARRVTEAAVLHLTEAHSKAPLCPMVLTKLGTAHAHLSWFSDAPEDQLGRAVEMLQRATRYSPGWNVPVEHLRDIAAVTLSHRLKEVQLKKEPVYGHGHAFSKPKSCKLGPEMVSSLKDSLFSAEATLQDAGGRSIV